MALHGLTVSSKMLQTTPDELLTTTTWNTPMQRPILSGTFTPITDKALVQFPVSHGILEPGGSWVSWNLYYGPTGTTPLTPKHQGDALTAGVQKALLGSTFGAQASGMPSTLLTGLTAGQQYSYELSIGLVGGAGSLSVPSNSGYVAVSKTPSAWPDGALITAVKDLTPNLRLYKSFRQWGQITETSIGTFALPAGTAGKIRVTPDGSRVVVCNNTDGSVSVYTTGLLTGAAAALQAKYVFPGTTTPRPLDVAIAADNVTAWVVGNHDSQAHIHKMDITTGTFSTDYNIGAASLAANSVHISPDGLYLVVAYPGDSKVRKVRLSDGVVTASPALPGVRVAKISVDGTYVFAATSGQNPNQVYKLNFSDMTVAQQVNMPANTHNAEGIGLFPDGRGFLVVCSNSAGGSAIKQFEVGDLSNYVNWGNTLNGLPARDATDIAITNNGTIYICNNGDPYLNIWHGGSFTFTPNSSFFNHVLRSRFLSIA